MRQGFRFGLVLLFGHQPQADFRLAARRHAHAAGREIDNRLIHLPGNRVSVGVGCLSAQAHVIITQPAQGLDRDRVGGRAIGAFAHGGDGLVQVIRPLVGAARNCWKKMSPSAK
jgi:hypothetical protein